MLLKVESLEVDQVSNQQTKTCNIGVCGCCGHILGLIPECDSVSHCQIESILADVLLVEASAVDERRLRLELLLKLTILPL